MIAERLHISPRELGTYSVAEVEEAIAYVRTDPEEVTP